MTVAVTPLPFGGSLSEGSLEPVLVRLGRDEVTGILTVQGDEDIIAISFEDGRIVGADALNEPLESGLGRALVADGLLTPEQLSQVIERIGGERGRISEILASEANLSGDDYLSGLRSYTCQLVRRSCSWTSGEYKFFAGDEVSSEEGLEPIRIEEVCAPSVEPAAELSFERADVVAEPPPPPEPVSADPARAMPAEDTWVEIGGPLPSPPDTDLEIVALPWEKAAIGGDGLELRQVERKRVPLIDRLRRSLWWVLPAAAAGLLLAVVLWRPNLVFYPGFWLEPQRLAFEQQTRASEYQKIDRAAKTFFLLEGRFPEDLHTLVARELLSPRDVVGPGGKVLTYVPGDRGYMILPAVMDGTDPGVNEPEAIAGDFFLDPEYVVRAPERSAAPLVLLD